VVSMVGSLGATLSGVTFPLMAMYPIVQYAAMLFPVRHFTVVMQQVVYSDGTGSSCTVALGALILFPLLALALLPRLRLYLIVRRYDRLE
jgi:ABC-2 type transport system permease protein